MGWDGMGGGQLVGIELVYAERVRVRGGVGCCMRRGLVGGGGLVGLDGRGNGKWGFRVGLDGVWEMGGLG